MTVNLSKTLRKVLETHGLRPTGHELMQKCTGCPWIGWNHRDHLADVLTRTTADHYWIHDLEQLKTIIPIPGCRGAVVRSFACSAQEGIMFEQRDSGSWISIDHDPQIDLLPHEVHLPVMLLWEPRR